MRNSPPEIEVRNRQRTIAVSASELQTFAEIAIALTWERRRTGSSINSARAVHVILVSDRVMAQLHKEFCGVAGPTDVLTFQHGEIVTSAQTAVRQAHAFGSSIDQELRLYILHGLLHLCGYDDRTRPERATMERMQRRLLRIGSRKKRASSRLV